MTGVQETFTAEKIEELRKNIDFSDIPELTSMEGFVLKNFKPRKKLSHRAYLWVKTESYAR